VPVGYSPHDRKLLVNKKAEQVRRIFELYLELGCVAQLKDQLDGEGVKARCASARVVKSQEVAIKGCFRGEDGCPLEISSSFLAGVSSRASSSGISHCIGRGPGLQRPYRGMDYPKKLSRSHCATQKAAIRGMSLNLIFHNCTFSKKVLDTFGNDGFRGKQDVAMVRCPRNRTGLLIRFTAIIATVLVQGSGCNLIGQRRNEKGDSIVGRSQFGNSFPQIMKSCIVRMFKRVICMSHRVP